MLRNPTSETAPGLSSSPLPDAPETSPLKRPVAVYPVLFGWLFVLVTYREIMPFGKPLNLVAWLVGFAVAILALQFLVSRLIVWRPKAGIVTALMVVPFCFFGDLKMQLERWLVGTPYLEFTRLRYLLGALVTITAILGLLVAFTSRRLLVLNRYLNFISMLMVATTVVQIVLGPSAFKLPISEKAHTPLHLGKTPPDIYYILTDAYTSMESLSNYWNYDNSPFINFLRAKGFHVVPNARSNFAQTPWCLAMYLNMAYPPPAPRALYHPATIDYACEIIRNAEVPSRLRASGYQITAMSVFATAGQPKYYNYPEPNIGTTSFAERLFGKTLAGYLQQYRNRYSFAAINLRIFSRLDQIAKQKASKPKFVYAHLMMPHEPFLFDRNGNRVVRPPVDGILRKGDYLDQLIYENSLLTNAVSEILRDSARPPIIIIQGDHGFRHLLPPDQKPEATTILNALYLPGSNTNWLYSGITPVNTFRVVFNHYFGEHYEYLPDELLEDTNPRWKSY